MLLCFTLFVGWLVGTNGKVVFMVAENDYDLHQGFIRLLTIGFCTLSSPVFGSPCFSLTSLLMSNFYGLCYPPPFHRPKKGIVTYGVLRLLAPRLG